MASAEFDRIGLELFNAFAFIDTSNVLPLRIASSTQTAAITLSANRASPFHVEASGGDTLSVYPSGASETTSARFDVDGGLTQRMHGMEAAQLLSPRYEVTDTKPYRIGFDLAWEAGVEEPFHIELVFFAHGNTSTRAYHRLGTLFDPIEGSGMRTECITTTSPGIAVRTGNTLAGSAGNTARTYAIFEMQASAFGSAPTPHCTVVSKSSIWAPAGLKLRYTPFMEEVS